MINKINEDIKTAAKNRESNKLNVLRGLKSAVSNFALTTKGNINHPISELEFVGVVRKQIKQRQDSATAFHNAKRSDLADKEEGEIVILNTYLPAAITEEEIERIIDESISTTGAASKKQAGQAIKKAVELAAGRIENAELSKRILGKLL